jgi:hypothetical protein
MPDWFTALQPPIQAAIISSLVGLLSALLVAFANPFGQRHLEQLKSSLKREESAEDARRQYEYEARKRLYAQFEPLLFQLFEATEGAYYRVLSLVRSSHQGVLDGRNGAWLDGGYYLHSTIYYMMLPAATFRMMSQAVNFVDLKLDPDIRIKYSLAKAYSWAFTDDYDFARLEPVLPYRPDLAHGLAKAELREPKHYKQGLYVGAVQNFVDTMIVADGERQRIVTFGEFQNLLQGDNLLVDLIGSQQEVPGWFRPAGDLFWNFDFPRRPVLARMLLTQALIARLILYSYVHSCTIAKLSEALDAFITTEDAEGLRWWDDDSLEPFRPSMRYIEARLSRFSSDQYHIERRGAFARWRAARRHPW